MQDFCDKLQNADAKTEANLALRRSRQLASSGDGKLEVACYMANQYAYFSGQPASVAMPFSVEKMRALMLTNPATYPASAYKSVGVFLPPNNASETYYRHYEISLTHFLSNGGSSKPVSAYTDFGQYVGGVADSDLVKTGSTLQTAGEIFFKLLAKNK